MDRWWPFQEILKVKTTFEYQTSFVFFSGAKLMIKTASTLVQIKTGALNCAVPIVFVFVFLSQVHLMSFTKLMQ